MKDIDYAAPKTVAEAVALFAEHGDRARALAGGTDIIVQVRENRRDVDLLVDLKHIPEVNELTLRPGPRAAPRGRRARATASTNIADIAARLPRPDRRGVADRRHPDSEPGQRRRQPVQRLAGRRLHPGADRPRGGLPSSPAARGRARCRSRSSAPAPGRTVLGRGEFLVSLRLPPPQPRGRQLICASFRATKWTSPWSASAWPSRSTRAEVALHRRPRRPGRGGADAAAGRRGRRGAGGRCPDRRPSGEGGGPGAGGGPADQRHARRRRLSAASGGRSDEAGACGAIDRAKEN